MKLALLVALMVLAHTAFTGARVALTLRAIALGGTAMQAGLVIGLLALVPMLLSVHAGRWTDRSGMLRPTLLALVLLEGGLLLALLPSLAGLGAAAVLLGCGFMLVHLAVSHAVGTGSAVQERTQAFSMLALGVSLSTMAGPVLAGFLLDLAGHGRTLLGLALLPLLALALLGAGRGALPCAHRAPRTARTAPDGRKESVRDLLRHPPLRAVFVTGALLSMGWDLFAFMIPMHGERIGLAASTTGLVMGAFGAGTFVVRLCMGMLARRFGQWQLLAGALGLTAAVYLLFPLSGSVAVLIVLAFVLGLALGAAQPTTMSAIQQSAPPGRSGEAIGVRTMLVNASQTALPMLFGAMGAAAGTGAAFWTLAAILAGGCLYAARQPAR